MIGIKLLILKVLRRILVWISDGANSLFLRTCYSIDLMRIRKIKDKIRVVFLVNEIAKWKNQTLYEALDHSNEYSPMIAVSVANFDLKLPKEELLTKINRTVQFFKGKGMVVVEAFDCDKMESLPLDKFNPDIVFYQHPWEIPEVQMPKNIAHKALTCYVPYYVQSYGDAKFDYWKDLHKQIWCYFSMSRYWKKFLLKSASVFNHAGMVVDAGHPALDYFYRNKSSEPGHDVIYAPHWSFVHKLHANFENFGTFAQTGKEILKYAQEHPDMSWIFKPHPTLRYALISSGFMTHEEVDKYWDDWRSVGRVCEDSDYQRLFLSSKVMITDCASFLIEYFATGKPIVHLISSSAKCKPVAPSRKILNTFYQVHNLAELKDVLDDVVENGRDDKFKERVGMLHASKIASRDSALEIIDFFNEVFRR